MVPTRKGNLAYLTNSHERKSPIDTMDKSLGSPWDQSVT